MFDQITGLPVHVLVIHAVVVFVPLTVAVAIAFGLFPRWRWVLKWPLVAGALISFGSTLVARQSGEAFFTRLNEPEFVIEHSDRGHLLFWFVLAFAVVSLAAAFVLTGPTPIRGAVEREGPARPIQLVVAVVLIVASLTAGVQVVRTGDSGARAVWSQ